LKVLPNFTKEGFIVQDGKILFRDYILSANLPGVNIFLNMYLAICVGGIHKHFAAVNKKLGF
jgi:hypothetical protein